MKAIPESIIATGSLSSLDHILRLPNSNARISKLSTYLVAAAVQLQGPLCLFRPDDCDNRAHLAETAAIAIQMKAGLSVYLVQIPGAYLLHAISVRISAGDVLGTEELLHQLCFSDSQALQQLFIIYERIAKVVRGGDEQGRMPAEAVPSWIREAHLLHPAATAKQRGERVVDRRRIQKAQVPLGRPLRAGEYVVVGHGECERVEGPPAEECLHECLVIRKELGILHAKSASVSMVGLGDGHAFVADVYVSDLLLGARAKAAEELESLSRRDVENEDVIPEEIIHCCPSVFARDKEEAGGEVAACI